MAQGERGTTRRNVLRGVAGAMLFGSATIGTTTQPVGGDDEESESPTETVRATVDRIDSEAQVMVLHTYDGREVTGSPDVYDIREGDVVDARLRAGEVVGVRRLERETRERREEMRERFGELSERPDTR